MCLSVVCSNCESKSMRGQKITVCSNCESNCESMSEHEIEVFAQNIIPINIFTLLYTSALDLVCLSVVRSNCERKQVASNVAPLVRLKGLAIFHPPG